MHVLYSLTAFLTGTIKKQREPQAVNWRSLKLKVNFEVKEYADAFVIGGYLPGMREEDIELALGKDESTLEVKGVREPTREEDVVMRRQLYAYLLQSGHAQQRLEPHDESVALLQLGNGRYGSFSQTFSLPKVCCCSLYLRA